MDPRRRLPRKEVDRILRLAAGPDLRGGEKEADFTLEDLVEVAEEVGIEPTLVRHAAAIRPRRASPVASTLLGAPDRRVLDAGIPGSRAPVDPVAVVTALEGHLGRRGMVEDLDDGFVWSEDHTLGRTRAMVRTGEEGAGVELLADRAGHYLATWLAGLLGWGFLAALTPLGSLGPMAAAGAMVVAPFLLARPFWVWADRRLTRRMEAALMAVLGELDRASSLPASREDPTD